MLTIPEAVAAHADAAVHKVDLIRTPGLFLVRTALAGAYIGIGVLIMVTAGGPLTAVGSPWAPLVNGAVFGIALTIVLVAGGELATSAMMVLTQGAMLGRVGWGRAGLTLVACLAGNLLGAMAFAGLLHVSGVLAPGTAGGAAIAGMIEHKAEATTPQLVVRGVLCNLLVCLAVWCWARLTSETARIVAVFACVLVFITSGFEHVVANMTTFALGLYGGLPHATVAEFARNVAAVGLGNTIGGGLLVGAAYAYGARQVDATSAPPPAVAAPSAAVPAPALPRR
ncbi:formate/nitrite transporter family protein [Cellulomonas dongxiuzhuiae]|uniref:Formate/nitrite transporter family protein n=1 Tax=Cellulomonas dongxiuzhuiae TaxID=2819979 RepID=A0ABX8GGY3_9CELL|nr:formate/nitrite transporter family protein [Cellulomonas dongxiuzhuiae]MBO3088318.1 formate/nitrite transporter family protein [Cellulomonas dongxiuzhuiae]MBO3094350.1 formate/nitrite transporter family protein [Cellulomonas dongxiuzhuiae]QWC15387.1 formate/nitrite transporter family protein [Cellulomonas dongxiuzhuiae]